MCTAKLQPCQLKLTLPDSQLFMSCAVEIANLKTEMIIVNRKRYFWWIFLVDISDVGVNRL